jgi:hypothetical protein
MKTTIVPLLMMILAGAGANSLPRDFDRGVESLFISIRP